MLSTADVHSGTIIAEETHRHPTATPPNDMSDQDDYISDEGQDHVVQRSACMVNEGLPPNALKGP